MKSVVIFCGASSGINPIYTGIGSQLGTYLATEGIRVIYGGASIGVMGAVADAAMAAGGSVIGIIPEFLDTREIAHSGLTELIRVTNMHDRKLKMYEMSDGIIALPGGWGTMEELFEMLTWAQLGLHQKPIGILNVNGYYDHLLALINHMEQEGFLASRYRGMLIDDISMDGLLTKMNNYTAINTEQILHKSQA